MQTQSAHTLDKTAVLIISSIASFLMPFMASSIIIALPTIGKEFSMDAVILSWVAMSYILAAAVLLIPFGRLADIYGRKRIFLSGVVIFSLASLAAGLSGSGVLLLISRVVQGIGAAMIFGTSVALITAAFPPGERGRAMGINTAVIYLGLSAGPFFGGFLTQFLGWRSIFIGNAAFGIFLIVVILWKLRTDWAEARGEEFDLIGSIIYGISIVAVIYGFSNATEWSGLAAVVIGIIILILFLWWESRSASPVLDVRLFRHNRVFAFSNLAAFINYSATYAISFLLSLYLQYIKGMDPTNAGLVLVTMPIVQAIFSPFTGHLSDRIEPRVIASIGMGFTTLGLLMMAFVGSYTQLWFIMLGLIILGFGFALFSSPNTNAIMSSVEKKSLGVASATLATMRLTGQMFSMGIAMLVISYLVGRVQIVPEYYPRFVQSVQVSLGIFTLLCFGGIFASLARGKSHQA